MIFSEIRICTEIRSLVMMHSVVMQNGKESRYDIIAGEQESQERG